MPTLTSHTYYQAAQAKLTSQSFSQNVFFPAHGRQKKETDCTTMAIRNAGEHADMKVITLNKLTAKRKVKYFEILHYA